MPSIKRATCNATKRYEKISFRSSSYILPLLNEISNSDIRCLCSCCGDSGMQLRSQFLEEDQTLVYVSERTGSSRLYLARPGSPKPELLPSPPRSLFHDRRPVIKDGRLYFISAHEPNDKPFKSWSALYSIGLHHDGGKIASEDRCKGKLFEPMNDPCATLPAMEDLDALYAWKSVLVDPNNVLQSWNPTVKSPCTWFHITCNSLNSVVRVDLGDAGLSGPLVPHLGDLDSLQYLEVYGNNLSGSIPRELGKLFHLISLDLYNNQLSGHIPPTLGKLKSLKFMRLNSNKLTGKIPIQFIQLIQWGNLQIM
ncbi:hypothetical protein RHGRI_034108 [Rhododendron griersonianum]|uniref:Leucine-rich repeat-containing N-terminal plant-type domain-containing protein n=1 Tax=Rhododendron griersonianum TaxID=479676 RepID=A0AAV6I1W5_9ERIC|nr:hypothetical protein RHGRI_034108 [Rhododendron griersonianum]